MQENGYQNLKKITNVIFMIIVFLAILLLTFVLAVNDAKRKTAKDVKTSGNLTLMLEVGGLDTMISEHFKRKDAECKCGCGMNTADVELVGVLETICGYFGQKVHILSWNRCEKRNKQIGGAEKSQHLCSKAVDIRVEGYSALTVYRYLDIKYPDKYGIGLYDSYVHIDVRDMKARWNEQ